MFGNRLVNFFYLSSDEDLNSRKRGKIKPIDIFAFEFKNELSCQGLLYSYENYSFRRING